MSVPDSKKVVVAALAGNLAIAACKFGAAYLSKSAATLAEAVHSVADTGNQALLLVGMHLAAKPPDERYPFGRSGEKYFWSFVVALMLFSVGGAFAIGEGVKHLLHPEEAHGSRIWSYAVLGVSLVFEALSFRVAFREFKLMAKGRSWLDAVREARDPTIPLVLAEDTTALVGLTIAFVAVLLTGVTGQAFWDPLGSVVIGVLLCVVAVLLARQSHGLIVGASATWEEQGRALELAEATAGVAKVTQIQTFHVGPDVVVLALKVAFAEGIDVAKAEAVTDDLEERIRAEMPLMRKIFVEPDSRGDGRGLDKARAAWAAAKARGEKPGGDGPSAAEVSGAPG